MPKPPTAPPSGNEGEGNRTADRRYRDGVRDHVEHHDMAADAQRARDAVDGPEGAGLRRAEEQARAHAKGEDPALHRPAGSKEKGGSEELE